MSDEVPSRIVQPGQGIYKEFCYDDDYFDSDNSTGTWTTSTPGTGASYSGLIHYWKFNESAGDASDEVSGGWTLTNTSASYISGKFGNASDFDDNEYLRKTGLNYTQPDIMTVEFWLKLNTAQDQSVVAFYKDASNFFYVGTSDSGGNQKAYAQFFSGTIIGNTTLTVGTWYHIAVVFDTTNDLLKLYVNGSSDASNVAMTHAPLTGITRFTVGEEDGITNRADFSVDDLRIWEDERTQSEIEENMGSELVERAEITLNDGEVIYTKAFAKGTAYSYYTVQLGDVTNSSDLTVEISGDGKTNWETVTLNTRTVFANSTADGVYLKLSASGATVTIENTLKSSNEYDEPIIYCKLEE